MVINFILFIIQIHRQSKGYVIIVFFPKLSALFTRDNFIAL